MTNEPIAWAVMQPDSYSVFVSYDKAVAHRDDCAGGDIIPLYRSLNLTNEEIEAIKYFASFQWTILKPHTKTLNSLLERINHGS